MGFSINADFEEGMTGLELFHRTRYHLGRGFVTPDDVVLDLGCGTGYGSEMLSQVAKHVIAVDIDEAQILHNVSKWDNGKIEFICHNMENWNIPKVDVAVAFETIEHTYDPARLIRRLKEAVKKYIIVSVPIGETLIDVNGDAQAKGDSTHHSVFSTPDQLNSLFIDDKWKMFSALPSGVTYIVIYYNTDMFKK